MGTCWRARRAVCILLLLAGAGAAQERREPVRGSAVLEDGTVGKDEPEELLLDLGAAR